jgi:hypothetical protein
LWCTYQVQDACRPLTMNGGNEKLSLYELADVLLRFPSIDAEQMSEVQNM